MARGTIIARTLKNGKKRYYVALWTEKPGGGRRQVWKTFEKRREAEAYLDSRSKDVREGDFVEPSKIHFADFAQEWLEKYPRLGQQPLKPSTLYSYDSLIEGHLLPFFGELRLCHIRSSTIEKDFKAQLSPRLNGKTVRNILLVLRRMLQSAVEWDYLSTNPFNGRKKIQLPALSRKQKGRALTPEEIRRLLDCCVDDAYVIVATAVLTGMRRSEVFGLLWKDIDFTANQIHVKQALYWKRGKHRNDDDCPFVFLSPKSQASVRKIDIGPQLRRILLEHKLKAIKSELGLVFANSKGNPVDPDNFVKRRFQPAVKAAGLGKLRFHDLRHTFGSMKIEQGENIKYVQVQMGHSDIKVTLDVYAHLLKDSNPEAAVRTDKAIFGKP